MIPWKTHGEISEYLRRVPQEIPKQNILKELQAKFFKETQEKFLKEFFEKSLKKEILGGIPVEVPEEAPADIQERERVPEEFQEKSL